MSIALRRTLFACLLCASLASAKQVQSGTEQQGGAKPKRDAALSFGGGGGSGSGFYHGPSHKYLPPSLTTGYESTYGGFHGNGLAASSGFDFASLDTDNTQHHYHHYSHNHHHHQQQQHSPPQHAIPHQTYAHHGHARPVYISGGGGGGGGGHHQQQSHHYRPHSPKVETYIVQTSNAIAPHPGQNSAAGYKYSSPSGSSFLSLLGAGHKQGHGTATTTSTYLLATPSYSNVAARPGHIFAPHFAPPLEHEEHNPNSGYSYEPPSGHAYKQQAPLSSYGVPLLPGYEHDQAQAHPHEQEQDAALHQAHHGHGVGHKVVIDQQTPAYALGHKGLGHFSYTSSKPHALNTDIHQLAAGGSTASVHEDHHDDLTPFKPSAFLGAKHEAASFDFATPSGGGSSGGGYDYATPGVLYGAPAQSGDSATPIFEAESTYLPPLNSYGAPATPTHNYH